MCCSVAIIHADFFARIYTYHATLSGSPQGSILSPVLSNIYLDKLDNYVETVLLPAYNRGDRRKINPVWLRLQNQARHLRKTGQRDQAHLRRRQMQQVPSQDPCDPDYRRLRYVRYADDWLLGFSGPRHEADEIKRHIGLFLREQLKLELSETKTLITHARTQAARFLGYEIVIRHNDHKHDRHGHRSLNGKVGLNVPLDVVRDKCARYRQHDKPIHRTDLLHDTAYSIVAQYQQEYRGVVAYYQLAGNCYQFNRLKWLMERSLTQTLAHKLRLSVTQVYHRYRATLQTDRGPRVGLQVTVERGEGRTPLVATWDGVSLARHTTAILNDAPLSLSIQAPWTELEQRLLADTCELCGSREHIQVHHVRALKDLRRKGQADRPLWVKIMAARQRKTLVVCRACHYAIHAGRMVQPALLDHPTLESRVLRKA